jgi:hypothetical protein
MRTPSPHICRLDLAPPLADRFVSGFPIDYGPVLLRRPFGFPSRWTPCPPETCRRWLQVHLGCIRLSLLCPCRLLHTFLLLRPARNYPRFWIWRSSFERQRDLNPPEQRAAQRAYAIRPIQVIDGKRTSTFPDLQPCRLLQCRTSSWTGSDSPGRFARSATVAYASRHILANTGFRRCRCRA